MKTLKKGVYQLADASSGIVIGIVVLATLVVPLVYVFNQDQSYSIAATHATKVTLAAKRYISDNSTLISATATPTTPYQFTAETLISDGYLPSGFSPKNTFSQSYLISVLEPQDKKFEALMVTTGGSTLKLGQAIKVANRTESGGYIDSGIAQGSQGSWKKNLSGFGVSPGDGHIAVGLFYSYGVSSNDYLYRKQIANHPELNTMSTDLSMGGNDINAIRNINAAGNAVVQGNIAAGNTVTATVVSATSVTATGTVKAGTTDTTGDTYTGNWYRTRGDTGWYSEKWGGGWHMTDGTWLRAYGGKSIFTTGIVKAATLQPDQISVANTNCPENGRISRDAAGGALSCKNGIWQGAGSTINFAAAVNQYVGDGGRCPANHVVIGVGGFYATYTAGYLWCAPVN